MTNQTTTEDFLSLSTDATLRNHLQNIHDSYSNPWDVLAELAQNSVDAIKDWEEKNPEIDRNHKISLNINQKTRSIEFKDSGIGINPSLAPSLLAPDSSNKRGSGRTIGEKGVGLTFCIFCSNNFSIRTTSTEGRYQGEIKSARTWRTKENGLDRPQITGQSVDDSGFGPGETGTELILDDVHPNGNGMDIFKLSPERLIYVLRTKTAIGNTKIPFDDDETRITIELSLKTKSGDDFDFDVDYRYWYPDEFWDEDEVVDIKEFTGQEGIDKMTDLQKQRALEDKCWKVEAIKERSSGPDIRYYGLWVPSKKVWPKISQQNDLYELNGDDEIVPDITSGIYVSTRGMPTGVKIAPPSTGSAGYWDLFYLVLGYDGFSWDYGRKTVPSATQTMLKEVASDQFSEMRYWQRFIGSSSKAPPTKPAQISRLQREDRFRDLDGLPNLNFDAISFLKSPNNQEAGVVSIFHELIGADILDNYQCMRAGYKQDYDFWGKYRANVSDLGKDIQEQLERSEIDQQIVIEFKYKCSSIIPDIEERTKHFNDIDLIICWHVDRDEFDGTGITVEPVHDDERYYIGSNYKLVPNKADNWKDSQKFVIGLSDFVDNYKNTR